MAYIQETWLFMLHCNIEPILYFIFWTWSARVKWTDPYISCWKLNILSDGPIKFTNLHAIFFYNSHKHAHRLSKKKFGNGIYQRTFSSNLIVLLELLALFTKTCLLDFGVTLRYYIHVDLKQLFSNIAVPQHPSWQVFNSEICCCLPQHNRCLCPEYVPGLSRSKICIKI